MHMHTTQNFGAAAKLMIKSSEMRLGTRLRCPNVTRQKLIKNKKLDAFFDSALVQSNEMQKLLWFLLYQK